MNSLKNIDRISELRGEKKEKQPGVYRWWFKKEAVENLLSSVKDLVEWNKIQQKNINDQDYLALYFGMTKNVNNRFKWHISQKHSPSAIRRGFISTLRRTLSALLDIPLSMSENMINEFIDANCILEWEYCGSEEEAKTIEKKEITKFYYPLNLHSNKNISKELKSIFSQKRKEVLK